MECNVVCTICNCYFTYGHILFPKYTPSFYTFSSAIFSCATYNCTICRVINCKKICKKNIFTHSRRSFVVSLCRSFVVCRCLHTRNIWIVLFFRFNISYLYFVVNNIRKVKTILKTTKFV